MKTKNEYPFNEGDNYWTLEPLADDATYEDNIGFFQHGVNAVQSCWDDQSEEFYDEDPTRELFPSLFDTLKRCRDEYDFIKISCFQSYFHNIVDGDYFVCEDMDKSSKFQKSY
jgi:hypothetical protein